MSKEYAIQLFPLPVVTDSVLFFQSLHNYTASYLSEITDNFIRSPKKQDKRKQGIYLGQSILECE